VIVASRVPAGRSFEVTYSMPGAEIDLVARGAILAGALSGLKARLRMLVGSALGIEAGALFPVR
jgi:L-asparaginase